MTDERPTPIESPESTENTDQPQPGHLGNDTSKFKLLDTDLATIARNGPREGRDPIPGVQEALQKLDEIDVDLDADDSDRDRKA